MEEDDEEFLEAMNMGVYHKLFPPLTEEDVNCFRERYRHSQEEREDLKEYYMANDGDVSGVLENIVLSEPEDVDRFIETFQELIETEEVPRFKGFKKCLPALRKNQKEMKTLLKEEKAALEQEAKKNSSFGNLVMAIRSKSTMSSALEEMEKK